MDHEAFRLKDFGPLDVTVKEMRDALHNQFAAYGTLSPGTVGVDLRHSERRIGHATIVFTKISPEEKQRLMAGPLVFRGYTLTCEENRAGKFAVGVATIKIPGNSDKDDELGSVTIRIKTATILEKIPAPKRSTPVKVNRIYPLLRVTSVAKHLHHGGHHITHCTRPGHIELEAEPAKEEQEKDDEQKEQDEQDEQDEQEAPVYKVLKPRTLHSEPDTEAKTVKESKPVENAELPAVEHRWVGGALWVKFEKGWHAEYSSKGAAQLEKVSGPAFPKPSTPKSLPSTPQKKDEENALRDEQEQHFFHFDEPFHFNVNEHSHNFMVTLHDGRDYDSPILATATVALAEIKACREAASFTIDLLADDGRKLADVDIEILYLNVQTVPDWHFMTDFSSDNARYKPVADCGFEGWVWLKGPNDHSFEYRWMLIQHELEPCVVFLDDVDSEQDIMKQRKHMDRHIVRLPAKKITKVKNMTVSDAEGPSKVHKHFAHARKVRDAKKLAVQDCEFEFSCTTNVDKDHVVTSTHNKWNMEDRLGTLWVHIIEAKDIPTMDRDGVTDAYCRIKVDGERLHTQTANNTLEPTWNEAFYFPIRAAEDDAEDDPAAEKKKSKKKRKKDDEEDEKTSKPLLDPRRHVHIEVYDDDFLNDPIIGKIDICLDDVLPLIAEPGSPGSPGSPGRGDTWDEWIDIERVKKSPVLDDNEFTLGSVHIQIKYVLRDDEEEVKKVWTRDDINAGRIKPKSEKYRLRTLSNERKYGWLHALNWVASGCPGGLEGLEMYCGDPDDEDSFTRSRMPPENLDVSHSRSAVQDPSQIDLPFSRFRHLLYNLARFQCLGKQWARSIGCLSLSRSARAKS